MQGDDCYYAIIKNVPMTADLNVQRVETIGQVCVEGEIVSAKWLDNGEKIEVKDNSFFVKPFSYGESYSVRIAKIEMK